MTNICGYDREALRKALEFANALDLDGISRGWPRPDSTYGALLFDVHDPAKLAAIIAELLRERGVVDGAKQTTAVPSAHVAVLPDGIVLVVLWFHTGSVGVRLAMSHARAFVLALLDAPNVTTQDIDRMIGEAENELRRRRRISRSVR